jgi:uncharacterized glyoxalase superfamily protein PhnB
MRYRDPNAAVDWLCNAFGFKPHQVFKNAQGTVVHAELAFGTSVLMIGPVADTPFGKYLKQPDEISGAVTQAVYVIVDDADAHYAKAKEAGAEILLDIKTQDYGGRDYTCRDPEGHIWSFGTYSPWAKAST